MRYYYDYSFPIGNLTIEERMGMAFAGYILGRRY